MSIASRERFSLAKRTHRAARIVLPGHSSGSTSRCDRPSLYSVPMAATRLGPFTNLTGSGGPDFFRTLNLTGWVKDWSPRDSTYGEHALLVAEATPNPALVLDLSAEITNAQVEAACSVFGPVREAAMQRTAC